jgi:aryl-alcohol dehydrogenase-like predicted oxidoreductase
MKTFALGQSGVAVSQVGLGGFELGPEEGEQPDLPRAERVIAAAQEAGINWIDTAERYHETQNEALIGAALGTTEMLVSSKVGRKPYGSGFRRDEVWAACRASLERLGRDHIDVYFLHSPDETGVPLDETWGAMGELADAGLVRAIGLSNYSIEDVERCHSARPVDAIQDGLSLIDYLHHRALFARAAELGIAGVVFEPLGSGALSGRSIEAVRESWAGYEDWPFYERLLAGENGDRTAEAIERVREIGDRLGASVAQVAIAWVLAQDGVTTALAGTRSGAHLSENAAAVAVDLSAVVDELDALTASRD